MHPTHPADRPPACSVQETGGVLALASPVADRHTTAQAFALSSRPVTPSAVSTAESARPLAGSSDIQDRTLLWATAGDWDVIERLTGHPHQVRLPVWTCVACDKAWPCASARSNLLHVLGWMKVATFSAVLMELAVKDLRALNAEELWQRFIEWTEPPAEARELLLKRAS